jgi:perosamine synthetase
MSNVEVTPMSFEPGVAPSNDVIPLCVPEIGGNEWEYVKECLDTNWVSSAGPFVNRFEKLVAEYVGVDHAVAMVNGTAALQLALIVAGIKADDEVIVPALTFVAPANAVRYLNAFPTFVDVEPVHWQLDVNKLSDFLHNECTRTNRALTNRATGRQVKAILPVHILGHSCDMDPIMDLAEEFELVVVEDATESLGARYKGKKVGTRGHIACFSFNGNKIITTGGGGMIVTSRKDWADRARYLSTQAKDDPLEYIHEHIGFNFRLPNVQAAIGCAQMQLLDQYIEKKREIFDSYTEGFSDFQAIGLQKEAAEVFSIYWITTITVNPSISKCDSRQIMKRLASAKIQSRPLWHPINSLRPYRSCYSYKIDIADRLYQNALSLPSSVGLTAKDQRRVIEHVVNAVS